MSSTGSGSADVKTVISVPAETYGRVEGLTRRLGITRSEFYARAAVRLADELERADLTAAVDRALEQAGDDADFVRAAAARQLRHKPT